eukprot:17148-Pelagococcus_subviridis.AAC.1
MDNYPQALRAAAPDYANAWVDGGYVTEKDADAAATRAILALEDFYERVRAEVAEEVHRAIEIFPKPVTALTPLVRRVMEQRARGALDA